MPSSRADRTLAWLLRVIGAAELAAAPFVVAPLAWMGAVHDRLLGLGPLPHGPIVEYLARHLSALYCVHGAVMLAVAADVRRYRPLAGLLGWGHVALGVALVGTDLAAGFSWLWVVVEGVGVFACGGLLLALAAGNPDGRQRPPGGAVSGGGEESEERR